MIYFYSHEIYKHQCVLNGSEAQHCKKVLRKKVGDFISVVDGLGNYLDCKIIKINQHSIDLSIISKTQQATAPFLPTVAISLLKNTNRFEWFVEKSTEIGIKSIIPLICSKTEKQSMKYERIKNIAISAMKQSKRAVLPDIQAPLALDKLFNTSFDIEQKFICHFSENNDPFTNKLEVNSPSIILIGPEGDFTKSELSQAFGLGFVPINLSNFRLRTETAGLYAVHCVHSKNYSVHA